MTVTPRQALDLLDRHGVQPSRALGQNFVVDPNTVRRIVRLAGVAPGDHVVEVGAGLGALTLALVEAGAEVTAVEVDRHLVPILEEVLADVAGRARVLNEDALEFGWADGLRDSEPCQLVANLPYNVATPLVLEVLDRVPAVDRLLVMVQREVAERLAAPPGSKTYGIPSVKVAYWAEAEIVGRVSPTVFWPRPRVESAMVRITRRPAPATDADHDSLFTLVRAGFGHRRKMLRGALAGLVDAGTFERAGIAPDARAEQLSVVEWGRLVDA